MEFLMGVMMVVVLGLHLLGGSVHMPIHKKMHGTDEQKIEKREPSDKGCPQRLGIGRTGQVLIDRKEV